METKLCHTLLIFLLLTTLSCNTIQQRITKAQKFEHVFNKNRNEYLFIENFMCTNNESIHYIFLDENNICKISNPSNRDDLLDKDIYTSIDDSLSTSVESIRIALYRINNIMLKQNITYIAKHGNEICFGFKYSGTPCYNLLWDEKNSDLPKGEILITKHNKNSWVYYLNENWYIKGIPCFP
jgi:hypothetical protein